PDARIGRAVFQNAGLHVQPLRGNPQALGDLLKDVRAGLAQPALHLAQIRVRHPGLLRELAQRDPRLLPLLPDVVTDRISHTFSVSTLLAIANAEQAVFSRGVETNPPDPPARAASRRS